MESTMRQSKQQAMKQYCDKWGLSDYQILTRYDGSVNLFARDAAADVWWGQEVRCLNTLFKRLNSNATIMLFELYGVMVFKSKEELLTYTLTKRLAGI